ncbi:unnamed protein product [Paramecium pentaurelia]|uniref:Palmitoyltransferase n=1 Tax=Paramecium pentaurelia TaxID=43138 RepID=A0A8S1S8S1_9CILI|nr:unnamed protein product [Paramecium pentaurelia]
MIAEIMPDVFKKYFPLMLSLLVLFIYFTFVYFVFIQISEQSMIEWIYVFIGTFSILMLFWALFQTSRIDPGFIPKNILTEYNETRQRDYCLQCRIKRPERSHHCSRCKRCVLNMDHHCVWTSNCIGLYNRKFFILILFWGSVGMLQATLLGLTNIMTLWNRIWAYDSLDFNKVKAGFIFLMTFSQFLNGFGLYYFFWSNFKLITINICTLDQLILDTEAQTKRKYHDDLTIYNLGFWYNFQFYFGKNPFFWFIPVGKPLGDGYNWDKKVSSREMSETTLQIME